MTTNKVKSHTRYKDSEGTIVPGVTTVLGILNKPALVPWANKLGLQGIDSTKYRDEMADIGTLAHYLIMCYLKKEKPNTDDYSKEQIDKAENCLLSFLEWEKGHTIEPILIEESLVSDLYGYGGTIDLYCKLDDEPVLIDFKTGKNIWPEMVYQLAAYEGLLIEHHYPIAQTRLLRIGRDEDEGFEEKVRTGLQLELRLFHNCLAIYQLQKEIKKEGR